MAITFPLLLALAAINWVLSWHVLTSNRKAQATRAFAFLAFCAGLWTIGVALTHHPAGHTILFAQLTFLLANLMIFAFVRMAFITAGAHRSWRLAWLCFISITGFASILAATPYLVVTARIINGTLTIQYGAAHPLYALHVIVCVLAGFCVLVYRYRLVSGVSRVRLRCLIIGLLLPAVGAVTTNLAAPLLFKRTHLGEYGPLFLVIFFLVTAHAFIRYRLLDVTLVIRRSVTWVLAVLASLVPLLLSLMFFWPFFSTKFRPIELALLLVGSMVIGLLTPIMRDVTGRALDKYVYRSRTNYQKTLRQSSRLMTRVLDLEELLELIGRAIVDSTNACFVAIFLKREDDVFLRVSQNVATEVIEPDTSPILPKTIWAKLLATKEPLEVEHSLRHVDTNPSCPSDAGTEGRGALLLPIVSDDDLIGVVALGKKMSGDPFYSQDVDLLSTLANQAGVAIKNAQLYEQVVLINEYLQNIVGTIESGVIAVNRSEHVTIFNRAAEQLTGLAGDRIQGRSISELPAVLGGPLRATAADRRQRVLAEVGLAPADSAALSAICLTSALREPAGGLLGAVAVFSDLTPLKQLETERRRAERLA